MKNLLKISLFLSAMLCWNINLQSQAWSAPNLNQDTYRNGNVAIGLTTPQAKLHLSKTTQESDIVSGGDPIPTRSTYLAGAGSPGPCPLAPCLWCIKK
jgi:hypothetical protein